MLSKIKSFASTLASHWVMTLVFVALVVVFLAVPIMNLLQRAPVVGPWLARRAAGA
jgi:succinate-acetate transporter protein